MYKRERILELVKEGIISVEEGLDLLESLSKEEKETVQEETKTKATAQAEEGSTEEAEETETKEEKMKADELEALANEMNQYSVEIDHLNEEILVVNTEIIQAKEELTELLDQQNKDYANRKKDLEDRIIQLNKEMKELSLTDEEETENAEQLAKLEAELNDLLEALYLLEENSVSDEKIGTLEEKIETLNKKSKTLTEAKNEKMKAMHSLKMKQWTTKAKQFSETMDIPKDWREGASKTIDKAGEILDEGSQTLGQVLSEAAEKVRESFQNFDWKEMGIDLSAKEKATLTHEWVFENTTASILDFKNTNGDIQFKKSMNDTIKVEAEVRFFELAEGKTPLAVFEEEATITVDADHFTFHVPKRKMAADLVIYLPERDYDYLTVQAVKGDIHFDSLLARDLYIKLSSGDLSFDQVEASMLEVKLSKGDVFLKNTKLKDLLVNTVNGDIRVIGAVESLDLKTVHGDVILTLSGENMIRLLAHSVKGDLKIALPEGMSFEIEARTVLGQVKSRLEASEKSLADEKKSKLYRFFRIAEGQLCQVVLNTTKGNILLKDNRK